MGQKKKIVVDTNIWVSISLNKTLGRDFNLLLKQKKIEILISEKILEEVARVLSYPKIKIYLDKNRITIENTLKEIFRNAKLIKPNKKINLIKNDPSDNMILECAVSGKAKFIVSGDYHLLSLKKFKEIKILSARNFLNQVKN